MPAHNWYATGEYNFACDICGSVFKSGEMFRGYGENLDAVVCRMCYTPQQPQDFVRVLPDNQSVPVSRARPPGTAGLAIWINNSLQTIPWSNYGLGILDWRY